MLRLIWPPNQTFNWKFQVTFLFVLCVCVGPRLWKRGPLVRVLSVFPLCWTPALNSGKPCLTADPLSAGHLTGHILSLKFPSKKANLDSCWPPLTHLALWSVNDKRNCWPLSHGGPGDIFISVNTLIWIVLSFSIAIVSQIKGKI